MKDGQELLLRGSGGAPFRVTVGQPFTREEISKRLESGEWSHWGEAPAPESDTDEAAEVATDPARPALNAPKADWQAYVAQTNHMSPKDVANYTKADLIDMVS